MILHEEGSMKLALALLGMVISQVLTIVFLGRVLREVIALARQIVQGLAEFDARQKAAPVGTQAQTPLGFPRIVR
jgi:hypothetical protein